VGRVELGKRRCCFHGGLSTGPRTDGGKARIAEVQRRRWARRSTKTLRDADNYNPPQGRFGSRMMSSLALDRGH
jgi:hypothetical protein